MADSSHYHQLQQLRDSIQYGALDAGSIRVLVLYPGKRIDPLAGELQTVPLEHARYNALSYVWGKAVDGQEVIWLDNAPAPINVNLHDALRRIRSTFHRQILWVDALCINQGDESEKSAQVAMMGRIYSRAEVVEIWLGESRTALSIYLHRLFWPSDKPITKKQRLYQLLSAVVWPVHRRLVRPTDESTDIPKPWWQQRVWTIQEMMLSHRIRWRLGGASVSSHAYANFMRYDNPVASHRQLGISRIFHHDLSYRSNKIKFRENNTGGYCTMSMLTAFNIVRGMGLADTATDPRDDVYGLTALLDTEFQELIGTDYALTFAQVCAKATYASILLGDPYLPFAYINPQALRHKDLPSWAIDFHEPSYSPLPSDGYHDGTARLSDDYKLLTISGMWLDRVMMLDAIGSIIRTEKGLSGHGPPSIKPGDILIGLVDGLPRRNIALRADAERSNHFRFTGVVHLPAGFKSYQEKRTFTLC